MTQYFNIKKNFGFGCMRLPEKSGGIDTEQCKLMFDKFLEEGFNYFDTAHGYHAGKSEIAIRECLTSRHPRDQLCPLGNALGRHASLHDCRTRRIRRRQRTARKRKNAHDIKAVDRPGRGQGIARRCNLHRRIRLRLARQRLGNLD